MSENTPYKISIDLNVLNHLGIGLYSNTPAVLTELVANAWDADAHNVEITLDNDVITIKDDGHGMSIADITNKFLNVGYARRNHDEASSPDGRQVMGRKGIGKLAMFSLANDVEVITKSSASVHNQASTNGFKIKVSELKDCIGRKEEYQAQELNLLECGYLNMIGNHGTVIKLSNLNKKITASSKSYFKRRIARRFSVIGSSYNFNVKVNNDLVTLEDRGFYKDIQFIWTFGDSTKADENVSLCKNIKEKRHFDGITFSNHIVNGFIASVFVPEQLKGPDDDDNNNAITLLANGRIFEEDVQKRLDNSKVFNSYLVGELQYDVLDSNDGNDIAVSSRQNIQEDDPRFKEFLGYIKTRLSEISSNWDEWRRKEGEKDLVEEFPKLKEWYESLPSSLEKKAKQLISKINTFRFSGNIDDQKKQRKEVVKSQILAFEKLRIVDNIDSINSLSIGADTNLFNEIMINMKDIEALLYRDITMQRLSVVEKLADYANDSVKEKIVQDHIYNNLWLIDPRWEYKAHPTEYEMTLTRYLKKSCPDSVEGARLDIGYRSSANRFIVVELKKPGLYVSASKLIEQGKKYVRGIVEYFKQNPDKSLTDVTRSSIDVIFIVDKVPSMDDMSQDELKLINGQIITYVSIVNSTRDSYESYLQASKEINSLSQIVENI